MKSLRLNIPENEYSSFLEFLKRLPGTKVVDDTDNIIFVSDDEKNLMRERVKKAKPGDFKSWDEVKNSFKVD